MQPLDASDDPLEPCFSEITAGPHRLDSRIQFVVSSTELVDDKNRSKNVLYCIDAAFFEFNLHWQVRRRYSDFYIFFDRMKRFFARRNVNTCPGCHGFRRALFDYGFPEKHWKGMGNASSAPHTASPTTASASTRFGLGRRLGQRCRSINSGQQDRGSSVANATSQDHGRSSPGQSQSSAVATISFAEHQVIESRRTAFHALVRLVASHTFSKVPKCQFCSKEPFRLVREFFVREARWVSVGNNNRDHDSDDPKATYEFLTGLIVPESFGPIADPLKSKIEFRRGKGIVKVLQIERSPLFFFRRDRSASAPEPPRPRSPPIERRSGNNTMLEDRSSSDLTRRVLNLTEPPMSRTTLVKVN